MDDCVHKQRYCPPKVEKDIARGHLLLSVDSLSSWLRCGLRLPCQFPLVRCGKVDEVAIDIWKRQTKGPSAKSTHRIFPVHFNQTGLWDGVHTTTNENDVSNVMLVRPLGKDEKKHRATQHD